MKAMNYSSTSSIKKQQLKSKYVNDVIVTFMHDSNFLKRDCF